MEKLGVGCPIDFSLNCKNLDIKCTKCACLRPDTNEFYYSPISLAEADLHLRKHPYIVQLKQDKSKQKQEAAQSRRAEPASQKGRQANRLGHITEHRVIKSMGGKLSYLSGAVAGAGDGELTVYQSKDGVEGIKLRVEHKLRISKRNTLGPTGAEWGIAQKRGIEVFFTTHKNSTVVTMSAEVFEYLLSLIKDAQE